MVMLFFVDESADDTHHFHMGLLARGDQVASAERELRRIVDAAWVNGLCSKYRPEVHGEEIVNMTGAWARGRNDIPGLIAMVDELLSLLARYDIKLISRGVELVKFRAKYSVNDSPHLWMFRNLLERFNEYLRSANEFGLIIADEHHQHGKVMRAALREGQEYMTPGYRSQQLNRIVDTLHFVKSHESPMTQLADLAAYVRRRSARQHESDRFRPVMDRWAGMVTAAVAAPSGAMDSIWRPIP